MDIRFADHPSFQRAAAGMVGGALLFGAALHPVMRAAPIAGGLLGIAIGAAVGYGKPAWRMVTAAAAVAVLLLVAPSWMMVAGVAALSALGLASGGPRGVRGVASFAVSAATVVIAMWCAFRIDGARETAHWPALLISAVSAAAMGIVGALATLPRHLQLVIDPVQAAVKKLPANLDAEVRDLCARSAAIWTAAQRRHSDDAGVDLVRDGVLKTLEVAARSADVKTTGPSEADLAQRMADLDGRIAAATDHEVKAQYQSARAALDDQQRFRAQIRQNRERLVARMHNHVAALEKFELAATGLTAARAGASTSVRQLEELSHDVAASGDALVELELDDTVSAPPATAPATA